MKIKKKKALRQAPYNDKSYIDDIKQSYIRRKADCEILNVLKDIRQLLKRRVV